MNPQARKYIESAPEAISGSGGHLTTLKVARSLYNGFGLDRQAVLEGLRAYNSRLSDKWSDRELEHKADSAATGNYDKARGWMLDNEHPGPRKIFMIQLIVPLEEQNMSKKPKQFQHHTFLLPSPPKNPTSHNTGAHAVGSRSQKER